MTTSPSLQQLSHLRRLFPEKGAAVLTKLRRQQRDVMTTDARWSKTTVHPQFGNDWDRTDCIPTRSQLKPFQAPTNTISLNLGNKSTYFLTNKSMTRLLAGHWYFKTMVKQAHILKSVEDGSLLDPIGSLYIVKMSRCLFVCSKASNVTHVNQD